MRRQFYKVILHSFFIFSSAFMCLNLVAQTPEEIDLASGLGIAYSGGGVTSISGLHSIKLNPAALSDQKLYIGSASYHWPSFGREYYQVGFIDAKTSKLTAAVQYTGFIEKYSLELKNNLGIENDSQNSVYDTPIKNRVHFALGHTLSNKFLLGMSANYVKASDTSLKLSNGKSSSISFGGGFIAKYTKKLNIAGSAENLFNNVSTSQPSRTFRVGANYDYSTSLSLGFEYKNRKRSEYDIESEHSSEHTGIAIAKLKLRDYLSVIGSYAKGFADSKVDHSIISGGVTFQTKTLRIGYLLSAPNKSSDQAHHALNVQLGFQM